MTKPNPFTPKSGEVPKVFLGRGEEKNFFRRRVMDAKNGRFDHYVMLGGWGIGKTVLMMHLKSIAQEENSLSALFPAERFKHFTMPHDLVLYLLSSIAKNIPFEFKRKGNFLSSIAGFGVQIVGTGFNLSFKESRDSFIDPQILLREGLINLWKDVKKSTDVVTVLIDDVQNYEEIPEVFITLKNVLSSEEILKKTKFLFVLSSTTDGWGQFLIKHHPIGRYFIPAKELKPFSKEESGKLVLDILRGTGVSFSDSVLNEMWKYTRGHPFELHSLGSALYDSQVKGRVGKREWGIGYANGLNYLGSTVFDNAIRKASESEKEILYAVSLFDETASLDKIKQTANKMRIEVKNVNDVLKRLSEKGLIEKPSRGHYLIPDKMFREYIKAMCK